MSDLDVEQARFNMIEQQVRPWDVLDQRVLDTLAQVPRERFVPEPLRHLAFSDTRIPLGHGEVMMRPIVEGRLLQSLGVRPGDRVLEIGTGSGFITACLSRLGGRVTSLEIHPDLSESAARRLADLAIEAEELRVEDGMQPLTSPPGYDVIAVTGSVPQIPEWLREALVIGGRMFVIHGESPVMEAVLIQRSGEREWLQESLFETDLPYLVNAATEEEPFVF